jgi:hypothetical protein
MTTFTFRIDGLKDRLVELEDTIMELQEQQKDLLAVRGSIEDIISCAADRLAEAQREILCDAEDCVINVMDAVGLEVDPHTVHEMWEYIKEESQEY